jgi:hypothetical protein
VPRFHSRQGEPDPVRGAPPLPPRAEAAESSPAMDSVPAFLQLVRRSQLLNTEQLNEVKVHWLPGLRDAQVLAERLIQRGWLTPYQVDQIFEGQDRSLVLGPYLLLDLLGEGALGQVFEALHRERRCVAALKVLRPELRTNDDVLDQFWQEREVLASLDHPAFVRAYDMGPDETQYYFAMEYVDGIDLGRLLRLAGPLPAAQACDYVRQTALGLQYAFEKGLVHRDVKPHNLLVAFATDQLRILDIGSARQEWRPAEGPSGALMGTADYIAPEQVLDPHGADTRADIYSLGCTFYHLLTGRPPFPGGSLARKLLDHQKAPPPALRQARPDVPEELETIVGRMLAKKPADRFQTPALVAVALASFCQDGSARLELERFRPQGVTAETLGDSAGDPGTLAEPAEAPPAEPAPAAPAEAPWDGVERRASPRRGANLVPVLVRGAAAQGEPVRAWVLDRSNGGLGLLVGEPLEVGTVVGVCPDQPGARAAQVRIVYCKRERIRWRVGGQFVEKLSWDVMRAFG